MNGKFCLWQPGHGRHSFYLFWCHAYVRLEASIHPKSWGFVLCRRKIQVGTFSLWGRFLCFWCCEDPFCWTVILNWPKVSAALVIGIPSEPWFQEPWPGCFQNGSPENIMLVPVGMFLVMQRSQRSDLKHAPIH